VTCKPLFTNYQQRQSEKTELWRVFGNTEREKASTLITKQENLTW